MTDAPDTPDTIQEPRCWSDGRWTAQVIKNEDDDGWAVSMTLKGEAEPALVGPWTMGRDKKNPKPLDTSAFNTLVKTAKEVIRRSEQQLHAQLNKNVTVTVDGQPQCVPAGITLATALLCSGARTFQRNPAGNDPRAPYCMMGACFECLVDVDGEVHTQSCMVVVREGMNVRTGRSVTEPGGDPA